MPNEQLWAPWRLTYLVGDGAEQQSQTPELSLLENADPQCFLCRASVDDNRRQTLTPWRGERAVVVLNRYPYINGHLLVAPRCHWARLDQLSADDHAEITSTITRAVGVLERLMKCEGFNIGLNLGRVAGAGVPGICTGTSFHAGTATPISCPFSPIRPSSRRRLSRCSTCSMPS